MLAMADIDAFVYFDGHPDNRIFGLVNHYKADKLFKCTYAPIRPNIILMQFTGLHDKNGKEIWEGDVVITGEETGEVQYDPDQSGFIILFYPNNAKQKSGCAMLASTFPSPSKEVIGNIYENEDLLKNNN